MSKHDEIIGVAQTDAKKGEYVSVHLKRPESRWKEIAEYHARNEDYYRSLLIECAGHLGPEVFISDDGSVQDSPLLVKVPELVARLAAQRGERG